MSGRDVFSGRVSVPAVMLAELETLRQTTLSRASRWLTIMPRRF